MKSVPPARGYKSAKSLASRTQSADATVVSNASSKPPTNITTNQMPPSDQQTMIKYTNSLGSELNNAREHASSMTTTQKTLLQHLEDQQKTMLAQQNNFMAIMTKTDEYRRPRNNQPRERGNRNQGEKRKCNRCRKEGVYHQDDECFSLYKNKDKRPSWY